MPYLFDTDAISELLKARPSPGYVRWLSQVQPEDQFTSAIVIGELFRGAFRSAATARHLKNIESRVLPSVVVLPYDVAVARIYGEIHATLSKRGDTLADADVQIAATALHHHLQLVTGNLRHFRRVPGLHVTSVLADSRR